MSRDPLFQQFGSPIPLKRPVMTAEPSIVIRNLKPHDLFLIFASDGLWEQLSDEAAVEIVLKNPRIVRHYLVNHFFLLSYLHLPLYLHLHDVDPYF